MTEVQTVRSIYINELYGPVLQGEGPDTGRPFVFLRLAGCNLDCSWCDTPYSWDWTRYSKKAEMHPRSCAVVAAAIEQKWRDAPTAGLCITGGEPLVQQKALAQMLLALPGGHRVTVETNGTRVPTFDLQEQVDGWVVSPKLTNSGIAEDRRLKLDVLDVFNTMERLGRNVAFKFVVQHHVDLAEVEAVVEAAGIAGRAVWVMPEGVTAASQLHLSAMTELVQGMGWNMTLRQHVITFGNARAT